MKEMQSSAFDRAIAIVTIVAVVAVSRTALMYVMYADHAAHEENPDKNWIYEEKGCAARETRDDIRRPQVPTSIIEHNST